MENKFKVGDIIVGSGNNNYLITNVGSINVVMDVLGDGVITVANLDEGFKWSEYDVDSDKFDLYKAWSPMVGDKVHIKKYDQRPGEWNMFGNMDKYMGTDQVICSVYEDCDLFEVEAGKEENGGHNWSFKFEDIAYPVIDDDFIAKRLTDSEKKEPRDEDEGKVLFTVIQRGGEVFIKRDKKETCLFDEDADILLSYAEKFERKIYLANLRFVCIESDDDNWWTVGRIYTVTDSGKLIDDTNDKWSVDSEDALYNGSMAAKFLKIVE